MNHRRFPSSLFPLPIILVLQVMLGIPQSLGNPDMSEECRHAWFKCGNISVGYPFSGPGIPRGCGHPGLQLVCKNDTATIEIVGVRYQVLEIQSDRQTLRIARMDVIENDLCKPEFRNSILDYELFDLVNAPDYANATVLYGCQKNTFSEHYEYCSSNKSVKKDVWIRSQGEVNGLRQCSANFTLPILKSLWEALVEFPRFLEILRNGFEVEWKLDGHVCWQCFETGGACGFNSTNQTICYCPDNFGWQEMKGCLPLLPPAGPNSGGSETKHQGKKIGLALGLGIAGAAIVVIVLGAGFFHFRQRRKKIAAQDKSRDLPTPPSSNLSQSIPSYSTPKYDLEKGSTYFGVHVFSYEELEQATENFNPSKELGEGGFGTVYYGVLNDGRVVAVKRLYESNFRRLDQYMNEIEILTRLRHPNLVTLYGCTSRRSRELLLVYEYIPNGTVADHLHGKRKNSGLLTWPVRLSIAVETATALAYLHATDIIHRDVKTNNILLDKNFHVKVADFGLSRLFPNDVTHVSTAPQGTPGYVDPEYYQCYQLTEKSDVYSFGVVLIELISAKQAVDTNRHRHDINLANMAVNRIQNHALHELVDPSLGLEEDYAVKRMMTGVAELAFRCLQQERDMRPSMEEVLEALRGIQDEELGVQKAEVVDIRSEVEVVDIRSDNVGLLKHIPPPPSPDSVTEKWMQIRTM